MIASSVCDETVADPLSALVDAIVEQLAPAAVSLGKSCSTPWASATFSGARHEVALTINGTNAAECARAFVANVAEFDFDLGGHIVVDIVVPHYQITESDVAMTIECLSVEGA
jgi:hypothetical protein